MVAVLQTPHTARAAPSAHALPVQRVSPRRPITGERTALPVIGRRTARGGAVWLRVLLPGRPNGHAGWIRARSTDAVRMPWRLAVDVSHRRVTVYRLGRPIRVFRAVVGRRSTPTPHGEFFVEEAVEVGPRDVGGPFALALSARSTVFQEFAGGPGQIALHGRSNVGGVLGTAASHGCIRLDDEAMRWLVQRIGPGVPVSISD